MRARENAAPGKGTRIWRIWLAVGLIALAFYRLVPSEAQIVYNVYYAAFGIAAAVLVALGIYLHRPAHALP